MLIPTWAATFCAADNLSPESRTVASPRSCRRVIASIASSRTLSDTAMAPTIFVSTLTCTAVHPSCTSEGLPTAPTSRNQSRVPTATCLPSTTARAPHPGTSS
eukprot:scaffold1950_cov366-Prasinococcus_capsulatus_cf.AAC.6